jgi:hypothetical protein
MGWSSATMLKGHVRPWKRHGSSSRAFERGVRATRQLRGNRDSNAPGATAPRLNSCVFLAFTTGAPRRAAPSLAAFGASDARDVVRRRLPYPAPITLVREQTAVGAPRNGLRVRKIEPTCPQGVARPSVRTRTTRAFQGPSSSSGGPGRCSFRQEGAVSRTHKVPPPASKPCPWWSAFG